MNSSSFESLPEEILVTIFRFCSVKTLFCIELVCKSWYWSCWRCQEHILLDGSNSRELSHSPIKFFTVLLKRIRSVPSLHLFQCKDIPNSAMQRLTMLVNLRSLSLSGCSQPLEFIFLTKFTALRSLDLTFTKIADSGMRFVSLLTSLETLRLTGCYRITDVGFSYLLALTNLKVLDLTFCRITDNVLKKLTNIKSLQKLFILGCPKITKHGVLFLTTNMPHLFR
jgi:Leucine-rich repeat (LRR) protein